MIRRAIIALGILSAIAVALATTATVSGQSAAAPPLVVTAYNNGAPIPYTMPRTPWGDPDLQGVWTSDDTPGIPMQRPQNVGTGLYQTDEQWAARQKQIADGVQNARERRRLVPRRLRPPRLPADVAHRRSARRPAAGGHARGREAPRAARPRHVRQRSVRHVRRLHALRPLHHPRHRRLGAARRLRQRQPHRAGAGHGGDQLRDDPRHARHLHRRPAAPLSVASASISATRAPAGKATSWWSRRRTSPTRPASARNGNGLRHSDKMKITERFKRVADDVIQYQITVDDPVTYKSAVHDVDAADAARGRACCCPTSATKATAP